MKRRQLLQYVGAGAIATVGTGLASSLQTYQAAPPSSGSLSAQWLGHTSFLFTGNGQRILVNPFQKLGCTAKYRSSQVAADLVLISSFLLDEGAVDGIPGDPKVLYDPGVYKLGSLQIQGISIPHDRLGGKRFGNNVAWKWKQGGLNILHLGGAAAPIELEQKILMGSPDVLFIPVGGGPKAYTPEEARQAISTLNPKLVIPTHYRTQAADASKCDIAPIDDFLKLMTGTPVRQVGSQTLSLTPAALPKSGMAIATFSYKF